MFDEKLQKFLYHNDASRELFSRLNSDNVITIEDAWNKASDEDLIWIVTRPSVMNSDQIRCFLYGILNLIDKEMIDESSKKILNKIFVYESIEDEDVEEAKKRNYEIWNKYSESLESPSIFNDDVANQARSSIAFRDAAKYYNGFHEDEYLSCSYCNRISECVRMFDLQAKWVRENFNLCDLHTN